VKTGFTQTEYLTYIIYFRVSTWLDIAFHAPTLIGCLFVKDRFRTFRGCFVSRFIRRCRRNVSREARL
jgi:hypothetical protein